MFHRHSIPNLLGVFRILATPFLMWLILLGQPRIYLWATLLLILIIVTDMLDGYLARRLNVVSSLGIFLDTISDKVVVTGVLVPMVQQGLLSGWIALIIIVREFIVSGLRSFAAAEGEVISAGQLGKQKLVITIAALVWRLLAASTEAPNSPYTDPLFVGFVNLWPFAMALAVIWTIASGVDYIRKAWPLLADSWTPIPSAAPSPAASPSKTDEGHGDANKTDTHQ